MQIKKTVILALCLFSIRAFASSPRETKHDDSSATLIEAAKDEIEIEHAKGETETACDLYLENVLNRAGLHIAHFLANELDSAMHRYLPDWKMTSFTTDDGPSGSEALRKYLNSYPDETAFVAQWPRTGRSGHVALVVKEHKDVYTIYQAQQGLSLPGGKPTKLQGLLYPKGQWGDRSHLRLFANQYAM